MRVRVTRDAIDFTVIVSRRVRWHRRIAMQPPHTTEYRRVEREMKWLAWREARG